jgi:hypothetical protein
VVVVTALLVLSSAATVVGAVALWRMASMRQQAASERRRDRTLQLIQMFAAPAASPRSSFGDDPQTLLAWQPLVAVARKLFPEEFAELDRARGAPFPFGPEQVQAAHARWSADWLAWELAHNDAFKLKAARVEAEIAAHGSTAIARAELDAIEREKLDLYQRRYAEYVRVSKALQALV